MFGKLMKYELRYLIRIFAPMWVIVLGLCLLWRVVNPASVLIMNEITEQHAVVTVILTMLAIVGMVTMSVVGAVVLIQRIYKGMYGDEGYLMMTLPVTTGQIINAKALCGALMLLGTGVFAMLGILLFTSYGELWGPLMEELDYMLDMVGYSLGQIVMFGFWVLLLAVVGCFESMYMLIFTISAGQLWRKHPIIGAILVYYGIQLVFSTVTGLLGSAYGGDILTWLIDFVNSNNMQDITAAILYLAGATVVAAVVSGLCFLGSKLLLDKKLNIA